MVKIYGASDDLVEIKGSDYLEDEIPCYNSYVRLWFDDGAIIQVSYPKHSRAIWMVCLERQGSEAYTLEECNNEDAEIYSDVYTTEAEIIRHAVVRM